MVEKIIVNPSEVRGLGDILEVKSTSDFTLYGATLSSGTDTVYGASSSVFVLNSTNSHDYSLSFGSASYTATGGSCTVTVTLTDGGVAVNNASITVTGGTGGSGSGTTNSSGVATINVTGITASGTLTASFQSVTATASVTYSSHLFYDDCTSSSGLSNYGSSVLVRGTNAAITMTYDSTENAYKLSGTGNYHAMIPIPTLDDEDNYKISADFKAQNINANACGFFLDNRSDTTSYGLGVFIHEYNHEFASRQYKVSSDGTLVNQTGLSFTASNWYTIEMIVNGSTLTGNLYNGNTLMATVSQTLSVSNKQMGLFLFCEKGATNSVCYVKNIVANTLPPAPVADSLAFSQSTYTCDMLDGVTVNCTLTDNGSPVSGATVTFSRMSLGLPTTVTATTNGSGVATRTFEYFDFDSFPATLTATYDNVTTTCTIEDGGLPV